MRLVAHMLGQLDLHRSLGGYFFLIERVTIGFGHARTNPRTLPNARSVSSELI